MEHGYAIQMAHGYVSAIIHAEGRRKPVIYNTSDIAQAKAWKTGSGARRALEKLEAAGTRGAVIVLFREEKGRREALGPMTGENSIF